MAFTHQSMPAHPSLIASYCRKCKCFVAASPRPSVLKSAEKAHVCSEKMPIKKEKNSKSN